MTIFSVVKKHRTSRFVCLSVQRDERSTTRSRGLLGRDNNKTHMYLRKKNYSELDIKYYIYNTTCRPRTANGIRSCEKTKKSLINYTIFHRYLRNRWIIILIEKYNSSPSGIWYSIRSETLLILNILCLIKGVPYTTISVHIMSQQWFFPIFNATIIMSPE